MGGRVSERKEREEQEDGEDREDHGEGLEKKWRLWIEQESYIR